MRDSSVEIRPYRPADRPFLLPMLERVYNQDVRRRHEILWDWWQDRHRLAPDPDLRPTVVEREGRIAGFMGMQFRRFKIGRQERTGVFASDSFTDPAARGAGIPLFRHLLASTDILLGAPVPRTNMLWKKVFGREEIDVFRVRKGKRVLDPAPFLSSGRWAALSLPARWAWDAAAAVLAAFGPRLRGAAIEEVERFPPEADDLCRRWLADRTNAAHRDATYLNWRFAESPVAYRKVVLRQAGAVAGLAAFRVGRMNGRRILLLVELLAAHRDLAGAYGSLIGHALAHGRRAGAADAQTLDAGCPALRRALRRWGFLFRDESMPVIGKMGDDRSDACPIYRVSDWFISAGDSDFEFTYFNQGRRELEASAPAGAARSGEAVHA